jgi:hypothetical protein
MLPAEIGDAPNGAIHFDFHGPRRTRGFDESSDHRHGNSIEHCWRLASAREEEFIILPVPDRLLPAASGVAWERCSRDVSIEAASRGEATGIAGDSVGHIEHRHQIRTQQFGELDRFLESGREVEVPSTARRIEASPEPSGDREEIAGFRAFARDDSVRRQGRDRQDRDRNDVGRILTDMRRKVASDEGRVERERGLVKAGMKLFRPSVTPSRRERRGGDGGNWSCRHGGHVTQVAKDCLATNGVRILVESNVAPDDHLIGRDE